MPDCPGSTRARSVDLTVLPADLAAVYAGELDHAVIKFVCDQLVLPVEPAEDEFRRWLEAQPEPDWMDAA